MVLSILALCASCAWMHGVPWDSSSGKSASFHQYSNASTMFGSCFTIDNAISFGRVVFPIKADGSWGSTQAKVSVLPVTSNASQLSVNVSSAQSYTKWMIASSVNGNYTYMYVDTGLMYGVDGIEAIGACITIEILDIFGAPMSFSMPLANSSEYYGMAGWSLVASGDRDSLFTQFGNDDSVRHIRADFSASTQIPLRVHGRKAYPVGTLATNSPSPSAMPTPAASITQASTPSSSASPTASVSPSATVSMSPSVTESPSASTSPSPTVSNTASQTSTASASTSAQVTPSMSATSSEAGAPPTPAPTPWALYDVHTYADQLNFPQSLVYNPVGWWYVAELGSISTIDDTTLALTQLAGDSTNIGQSDGIGTNAQFKKPIALVLSPAADILYVLDQDAPGIRAIALSTLAVTTLAGSSAGYIDGIGTAAKFEGPTGLAYHAGYLYVSDTGNHAIRAFDLATGAVTTLAGGAEEGAQDGTGSDAQFSLPGFLSADSSGWLWVAASSNNAIRKVHTGTGQAVTVAGGRYGEADGVGTAAKFFHPMGIVADDAGNIFTTEDVSCRVRVLNNVTYNVVSIAGKYNTFGYADGVGTNARFSSPTSVALGKDNRLYVVEADNKKIRVFRYA